MAVKRISKRTRASALAARICSLAASNSPHLFHVAEAALGLPCNGKAGRIARAAYYAISEGDPRPRMNHEIIAEAESLIRTGWLR